jgi:hypothetical protein
MHRRTRCPLQPRNTIFAAPRPQFVTRPIARFTQNTILHSNPEEDAGALSQNIVRRYHTCLSTNYGADDRKAWNGRGVT